MFCPECGASITADFSSCPWCGAPITVDTPSAPHAMSEEDFTAPLFRFPPVTAAILLLNILLYILTERHGGSENQLTLLIFGAKLRAPIFSGAWWRLLTADFLHIGIWHLLLNSITLVQLGMVCENIYGKARFLLLYLVTGAAGFLASTLFTDSLSAGASASLFGLMGATLTFGWRHGPRIPPALRPYFTWYLLPWVVVMILFGLFYGGIDNLAHIGGLLSGVFLALVMPNLILEPPYPSRSRLPDRLLALLLLALCLRVAWLDWRQATPLLELLEASPSDPAAQIEVMSRYIDSDVNSGLYYFMRGNAQFQAKRYEAAEADLRMALSLHFDLPTVQNLLAWMMITAQEPTRPRLDEAVKLARAAVQADRNPDYLNTFGWALCLRGDLQPAISQLEAAYRGHGPAPWLPSWFRGLEETLHGSPDPGPVLDLYMLAIAYHKKGDEPMAHQKLKEGLQIEKRLEKPDPERERFRMEAEALLGLKPI